MAKRRRLVIVLLAVLGLLIAAGYYFWTRGVYVKITNSTQSTLKHIGIAYSGGATHITGLGPGTSRGQYINPKWESDLTLEWLDSAGMEHSYAMGVYIEHNYSGSVEITVEPGNRVSVTDKVRLLVIDRRSTSRTYLLQDDVNDVR
jgi:hypothetical protein